MMMTPFDVAGLRIVVTGGSGHLGSAICRGLSEAGANVLNLSSKPNDAVETFCCDVADEEAIEEAVAAHCGFDGCVDGLVQLACRGPRGISLDVSAEDFAAAYATSAVVYYQVARTVLRHMRNGGSIVNVGSMWGFLSPTPQMYLDLKNEPALAATCASAAILQMTRYLAVLVAERNIRVNALIPGCFPKKRGPDNPAYMAQITSRVPLARIGRPDELIGPTLFLLSDASSYMTGQQLVIDGGYSIQ